MGVNWVEQVAGISQTLCIAGPRQGGKTSFMLGINKKIEQETIFYMLLHTLFSEF